MPTGWVDYNTRTKEQLIELIEMIQRDRYKLEEENRKLKLHIEAKDKAYTALLKDYEEIKENEKLKEKYDRLWEIYTADVKERIEENRNLKEELGKITVHSNMLESENILLKKECKARLDKIEELEKEKNG